MISAEAIRKLELKDGDVLALPEHISPDEIRDIATSLFEVTKAKVLIIQGDVQVLDERSMNAAGWYRK